MTDLNLHHRSLLRFAASALLIMSLFGGMSRAEFVSYGTQIFSAEATIPDAPVQPSEALVIRHVALQGVSNVTKLAIIQAEVGANPNINVDFPSRISSENPIGNLPADVPLIRVTVIYRIQTPQKTWGPEKTLAPVVGPEPLPVAFQIPSADILSNVLQYKIKAERLSEDTLTVTRTAYYPADADVNPDSWISLGVNAQAAGPVISTVGGRITQRDGNPNDGETFVDVPAGLFASTSTVMLEEYALSSTDFPSLAALAEPVALYRFSSDPFKGTLRASLLYSDFDFANGGQQGKLGSSNISEQKASVFWWDGFVWRRLGSSIDPAKNTMLVRLTSSMQFLSILPLASGDAAGCRPMEKVFTPNGDNNNDLVTFSCNDIKVEFFDITGRRVRTLNPNGGVIQWDGRDDSGSVLESGVYIYQYDSGGTLISGVVAVAK